MEKNNIIRVAAMCAAALAMSASAATLNVPGDYSTLADALAVANDGDVIQIADGTYQPTAPVLVTNAVEIVGNDSDRSQVVFDGQGSYKLMSVSNDGAFIHGITFYRGKGNASNILTGYPDFFHGCSFEMNAGTVSNCVIRSGKANYSGCVSMWGTARVLDCEIANGTNSDGNGGGAGLGGCVKLGGSSLVSGCTIYGGKAVNGGNVFVRDATALLVNCVISNSVSSTSNGGGVYVRNSGVISNCVIMANTVSGNGGGLYIADGKAFNTLVVGNTAQYGGGVCLGGSNARLINCTVADNSVSGLGPNLYRTAAAQTVNTIVAGGVHSMAGTDTTSCFDDNPTFRNAASGDYRLSGASQCVDAGTAQNWGAGATDLSGITARVIDGDGDGTDAVDIGAYEYDPATAPIGCAFRSAIPLIAAFPMSVTFTPAVEGNCGTVTSVTWNFGDGETETSGAVAATAHAYAAAGAYTITLTVETTLGGTLSASETILLKGTTTYLSTTGSATPPYATPATAARSLADAIAALGTPASGRTKVIVLDGTYQPTSPVLIMDDIEIAGNDADPSQVVFDGRGSYKLMSVSASGAFIHGITFYRGKGNKTAILTGYPSYFCGCSFEMNDGVASNCVFRSGMADFSGCVSMWGTAKLLDSLIENGENTDTNPYNAARGGGLKIAGDAEARRCTISGCKAYMGAGATVEGKALLADSTVTGSTVTGGHSLSGGAGIHIRDSAVVSNCVVRACTNLVGSVDSGYGGGGVHIQGGLLVNTLITGNRGNVGGGISQNGGRIVNCTVVKNTATTSASGVSQKSGQIVNTIIAGSDMNDATAFVTTGGTITYSCALGFSNGVNGNTGVDPMGYFRDPQSGDYSMLSSFPGIDAGDTSVVFADGATDVSGAMPRVSDGDGDSIAVIDMGAYEYDYASMPISVSLAYSVVAYEALSPTTVRFTPALEGPYGEVTSVIWIFGDGQSRSAQAVGVTDHDYAAAGTYTVTLTAETTLGGTLNKSVTFTLDPLVVYVSNDGSDEAPYDTAARATPSFADAIGVLGTPLSGVAYVIVADGNYVAPAARVNITKDIEIRGNDADPSRIVIDGQRTSGGNGRAFFFVNSPLALVHGVTFARGDTTGSQTSGAPANYSQAALEIASGMVSNCVIDNVSCSYAGGASVWGTGRLIDCFISNCTNRDGNGDYAAKGGGLKIYQNAYVAGCTITNCVAIRGAGLHMFGGTAENCVLFANSTKDGTSRGGGLCMESGTARNILVYGNRCHKEGGGVYVQGSSAVLECATVVDNTAQSGKGRDLYMTSGTARNCIVWDALTAYDSEDAPLVTTGGTVTYTCSPSLAAENGNISSAPIFVNVARGDYTTKGSSPTINAGQNQEWMVDASDLVGAERILNKTVDMGCYEILSSMPLFIYLR